MSILLFSKYLEVLNSIQLSFLDLFNYFSNNMNIGKCTEWVDRTVVHQDPNMLFSLFRMNEESEDVNRIWYWKQRNKKVFQNGRIDHIEILIML